MHALYEDAPVAHRCNDSSNHGPILGDYLVFPATELRGLIHTIRDVARGAGTSDRKTLPAVGERHRPVSDATGKRK
jgi:hypothetical protein